MGIAKQIIRCWKKYWKKLPFALVFFSILEWCLVWIDELFIDFNSSVFVSGAETWKRSGDFVWKIEGCENLEKVEDWMILFNRLVSLSHRFLYIYMPTVMPFEHLPLQSDAPSQVGPTRLKITSICDFCGPHHIQKWRGAMHHWNIQNQFWGPFERFFHDQNRPSCVSQLNVI